MQSARSVAAEVRRKAAEEPGEPIVLIDPHWEGDGPVPDWAVIGAWQVDEAGDVVGFEYNDEYRPTPERLGWPEPTDPVDAAIQFLTVGHRTFDDVAGALVTAEVAVLLAADGRPASLTTPAGEPAVAVFTATEHFGPLVNFGFTAMPVTDLLPLVPPGHLLYVNATAVASTVVPVEALRAVLPPTE